MKKWSLLLINCFFLGSFLTAQEVFKAEIVHEIKVNFPVEDWRTPLQVMKSKAEGDRIPADVLVDGVLYEGAGVRFKGNSSYNAVIKSGKVKLPLNIKLNYTDKDSKMPSKHKSLKLANGFRDPSFIRETLAYDIARQYMPASRAVYARVYVNEEYLGLYTLVESVDNAFLDHYFGDHDGVLFKCDPNYLVEKKPGCPEGNRSSLTFLGKDTTCYEPYYELKSDYGWAALVKLIDVLHHDFDQIESHLNVDQTLWMLAFDNYTVNLDSYLGAFCHNYYLYQDLDGVFHPIIWDLNLAFGGFRLPDLKRRFNDQELKETSMFLHFKDNNAQRPLLTFLLRKDLYRKVYLAHMRTLLKEQGQDSALYQRATELYDFISAEVEADSQKLYSNAQFSASLTETQMAGQEQIIGVFDLMNDRNLYLKDHPLLRAKAPTISETEARLEGAEAIISARMENGEQLWLCYRYEQGRRFIRQAMQASTTDEATSGVSRWQVRIPVQEGLQYYLIAENQKAATLLPERASFEFLTLEK
ncbi:MAG TPA: CotH kinase family protein [Saprospiraceae bacterium]|nr:CotH kinase family protein [Saprospiraceae bacterium]